MKKENSKGVLGHFLRTERDRWFLLLAIVGLQVFVGGLLWQSGQTSPALMGFLSERHGHFVLGWTDQVEGLKFVEYSTLGEALNFAGTNLKLTTGHTPRADLTPEAVWIQERFGNPVVFWKIDANKDLFQMTFESKTDALYFANAFRRGSYTPSPIGHSILLIPSLSKNERQ